jgi:hypothetical protein
LFDACGSSSIGTGGQTIFGPAPAVMPGVALTGMIALDRDSVWSPALFVGATHAWRNDLPEPGGAASFALDAASVDACPLRLAWSLLVTRPCVSGLVGRMASSVDACPRRPAPPARSRPRVSR